MLFDSRLFRPLFLVLLSVLLGVAPAQAQLETQFAFTAGPTFATLRSTGVDAVSSRTAFSAGAALRVDVPGPVSLQPEALFARRGTTVDLNSGDARFRYGASYLDVPVLLHVSGPTLFGVTQPHLVAGGYGSLKLFETQGSAGDDFRIPVNLDGPFYDRWDAGLMVGGGSSIGLDEGRIDVSVRYAYGLLEIARNDIDQQVAEAPFPTTGRTSAWSILLQFGF